MEFTLVSSACLNFKNDGDNMDGTMAVKTSLIQVDKLVGSSSLPRNSLFLTKLEDLLLVQGSREAKRQRLLSQPMDCRLKVQLFYGSVSDGAPNRKQTGFFKIFDFDEESNGLINRLVDVCGGRQNILADLALEFGRKDLGEPMFNIDFKDLRMLISSDNYSVFGSYFDFPESLAVKWSTQAKWTGTLDLTLRLNRKALSVIHGVGLAARDLVNQKLLMEADESGDGIIVVENGKEVRCHKVFLLAQSDIFKKMFNSNMKEGKGDSVTMSDMSEDGVKALLAYLYCGDIREAMNSSSIAVELLKTADKYQIDKLFELMKELILGFGDDDWFSVNAAVHLLSLVKNRTNSMDFKELVEKAKLLVKLKPLNELKECAEFRKLFENPDYAMETWSFFNCA